MFMCFKLIPCVTHMDFVAIRHNLQNKYLKAKNNEISAISCLLFINLKPETHFIFHYRIGSAERAIMLESVCPSTQSRALRNSCPFRFSNNIWL